MSMSFLDIYKAFLVALRDDDVDVMRRMVTNDFRADLPGAPDLSFDDYMTEIARQRAAFPDFAQNVIIGMTEESHNQLTVTNIMTGTFSNELVTRDGRGSLPPNGKRIEITSRDVVTFTSDGQRISHLTINSDMGKTVKQMG